MIHGNHDKNQKEFLKVEMGQVICSLDSTYKVQGFLEIDGTKYIVKKRRLNEEGLDSLIEKIRRTDEQVVVRFDIAKVWQAKGCRRFFEFLYLLKKEIEEQEFCVLSTIDTSIIDAREAMEIVQAHPLIVSGGKVVRNLYSVRDSQEKIALLKETELGTSNGKCVKIKGALQDITEKKKAEEAAKEKDIMFRELFSSMSDGVVIYEAVDDGKDFIFKDMNKEGQRLSKIKISDIKGKRLTKIFPGAKSMGLLDVLTSVWKTGKSATLPITEYKDDRIKQWVDDKVFRLPSGEVVAVYHDTTEKKRSEAIIKRLHDTVEQSSNSILLTDTEFKITYMNPAAEKMFGYKFCELEGKTPLVFNAEPMAKNVQQGIHKAIIDGKIYSCEEGIKNKRKDGAIFINQFKVSPLKDDKEKIIGYLSSQRDITEKKTSEQKLKENERLMRTGEMISNMGTYVWDVKTDHMHWSPNMYKMAGIKPLRTSDKLKKYMKTLVHPDDQKMVEEKTKKALKEGKSLSFTARIVRKDGKERLWQTSGEVIYNSDGKPSKVIGVNKDITEDIEREFELRSTQQRYKEMIESINEAIYTMKPDGTITYVSPVIQDILGRPPEVFIGKKIYDYLAKDSIIGAKESIEKVMAQGSYSSIQKAPDKSGKIRYLRTSSRPLMVDGKLKGLSGALTDITEQMEAHKEVEKTKDYLAKVFDSASEMMVSIEIDGTVTGWNRSAEQLTGFKKMEMIGSSIFAKDPLKNIGKMLKLSLSRSASEFFEVNLTTKDGLSRDVIGSTSLLKDFDGVIEGLLFIGRRTSRRKKVVEAGKTYMVSQQEKAFEVMRELKDQGYNCIIVVRQEPDNIIQMCPEAKILWLTRNESPHYETAENTKAIAEWLEKNIRGERNAIFVERSDYIGIINGFDALLKMVYGVNDLCSQTENVALIHVTKDVLSKQQEALLREELEILPESKIQKVNEQELALLRFVHNKNMLFMNVYFKDISKKFNISKITTKKIISGLASKGMVNVRKTGRLKCVEPTEESKKVI